LVSSLFFWCDAKQGNTKFYFNFFLSFAGGKKFSPVTTLLSVLDSKASLASLAIFPPFLPALALSMTPFASTA